MNSKISTNQFSNICWYWIILIQDLWFKLNLSKMPCVDCVGLSLYLRNWMKQCYVLCIAPLPQMTQMRNMYKWNIKRDMQYRYNFKYVWKRQLRLHIILCIRRSIHFISESFFHERELTILFFYGYEVFFYEIFLSLFSWCCLSLFSTKGHILTS